MLYYWCCTPKIVFCMDDGSFLCHIPQMRYHTCVVIADSEMKSGLLSVVYDCRLGVTRSVVILDCTNKYQTFQEDSGPQNLIVGPESCEHSNNPKNMTLYVH